MTDWVKPWQDVHRLFAVMRPGIHAVEALGVFVPVQVVFERAVADRQQLQVHRTLHACPPAVGIAGFQEGPAHDVQALLQHLAIGQPQHRHRALENMGCPSTRGGTHGET